MQITSNIWGRLTTENPWCCLIFSRMIGHTGIAAWDIEQNGMAHVGPRFFNSISRHIIYHYPRYMSLYNRYNRNQQLLWKRCLEKMENAWKCPCCNEMATTAKTMGERIPSTGMKPSDSDAIRCHPMPSDASWLLSATRPWGPQMKFTPSCFMMFTPHTGCLGISWDHVPFQKISLQNQKKPAPVAQKMRTKIHKWSQRPQNPWRRGLNSLPPILRWCQSFKLVQTSSGVSSKKLTSYLWLHWPSNINAGDWNLQLA